MRWVRVEFALNLLFAGTDRTKTWHGTEYTTTEVNRSDNVTTVLMQSQYAIRMEKCWQLKSAEYEQAIVLPVYLEEGKGGWGG